MSTTKKSVRLSDATIARLMQYTSEGVSFAKVLDRFARIGLDSIEYPMQELVKSAAITHPPVPPPMIVGNKYEIIAKAEIAANAIHNQAIMDEAIAEEEEEKSEEVFSTVKPKMDLSSILEKHKEAINKEYK